MGIFAPWNYGMVFRFSKAVVRAVARTGASTLL